RGLPDNWDKDYEKMISELKAAGLDKILVEVNKQLEEYRATRK
ncbi:MAG: DUF3502 domain-containing protein, partial [Bacilli bacterium]